MLKPIADKLRAWTGWGYDRVTNAFDIEFVREVGSWPILTVLPFDSEETSSDDAKAGPGVGLLLANLLRRDLLLTRGISTLGVEDSPTLGIEDLLQAYANADHPPKWNYAFGVLINCDGLSMNLICVLVELGAPEVEIQRFEFGVSCLDMRDVTEKLYRVLMPVLEIDTSSRPPYPWHAGPVSWTQFCETAECLETRNDEALLERFHAGDAHADALIAQRGADGEEHSDAMNRAILTAVQRDPCNAQLHFQAFCDEWRGSLPDLRAARRLNAALRHAPGYGKSQMCMAHLIRPLHRHAERILAHAEAGYRLLPGNNFAISNFMKYLKTHAPTDERLESCLNELIQADPYDPNTHILAVDHLLSVERPDDALVLARRFKELCTPPINPRTLYCFRQNPATAAAIDAGKFKPLDRAEQLLTACERRIQQSPR